LSFVSTDGLGQRGRPKEAVNASELTLYLDATAQDREEEWVQLSESQDGCKGETPIKAEVIMRGTERLIYIDSCIPLIAVWLLLITLSFVSPSL
jgi:hypothetical protein